MQEAVSELARFKDKEEFIKIINLLNILLDRIEKKDYKIVSGLCFEILKMKKSDSNIDETLLLFDIIFKHIKSPKWYFFWMPYHRSFDNRGHFWKSGLKKPRVKYIRWLIKYYKEKLSKI